jgi:flavin reductase (DIM6/NTAB) family NADH-FMN oxidoreductase RutF
MTKRPLPLSRVYCLLEPGPVVLLTTARRGEMDVMPLSWHTMLEFEPPLVGCVVSNRNHSFGLLKATRECVINIPTSELAEKVVACGNSSGRRIDKFAAFGLTPVPASCVGAPLIDECYSDVAP